jgi:hypothetical protein
MIMATAMTPVSDDATARKLEQDRNMIRSQLAMSPAERLRRTTGAYGVWFYGQHNLARRLAEKRGIAVPANYAEQISLIGHPVPEQFVPEEIFNALARHGVDFIVIDSLAIILYGAPLTASYVQISVEGSNENLERTALALNSIGGLCWTEAELAPVTAAADLRRSPERFVTDFGNVDVFQLHRELTERRPTVMDLDGTEVAVIDFDSLVRAKKQDKRTGSGFQLYHLNLLADERQRQDHADFPTK